MLVSGLQITTPVLKVLMAVSTNPLAYTHCFKTQSGERESERERRLAESNMGLLIYLSRTESALGPKRIKNYEKKLKTLENRE